MYYIFEAEISGKNELIQAEVLGKMPNFLSIEKDWTWWSDAPLPVPFPDTTFSIDENIYQDAYWTGSIFDLHSEKLATLIQASGARCEYFPVKMVPRKSDRDIASNYFAFHLMEIYSVIDYAKSTLVEDTEVFLEKRIVALELFQDILSRQYPLLRDKERPHLVFVHEELKKKLDVAGIKGCKFTHYKDFRDITLSDIGVS
jgi:hypothetical protein